MIANCLTIKKIYDTLNIINIIRSDLNEKDKQYSSINEGIFRLCTV